MSVFNFRDYRKALKHRIHELKKLRPGFGLNRLSERAGIHASYLSSALKGSKQLNQDQLFLVSRELDFTEKEQDYLFLLLQWDRASYYKLKKSLLEKIKALQEEEKKTEKHLKAKKVQSQSQSVAKYYSDPNYKLIHVFLSLEKFNKNPDLIAKKLMLTTKQVLLYLENLEKMQFIKKESSKKGSGYTVLKKRFHLPKDSFICEPHQSLMRFKSQQKKQQLPKEEKESVSVTFSADPEAFKEIHQEFLKFLKKTETIVKKSDSLEVFQLHFDLHSWS